MGGMDEEAEPQEERARKRHLQEIVEAWDKADCLAEVISIVLTRANIESSREAAMGMMLVSAEDCLCHDACSEEQFVEAARAAYKLRKFSRRGRQQ